MVLTRRQKKANVALKKKLKHVKVNRLKTAIRKHNKKSCIKLSQKKIALFRELERRNIKFGYGWK